MPPSNQRHQEPKFMPPGTTIEESLTIILCHQEPCLPGSVLFIEATGTIDY
jgi:hypothetical protein